MTNKKIILISYFGAKQKIAWRYPAPTYDTIIEPFAGGAGYSCQHYQRKVILHEKSPIVFGAMSYLIRASSKEIMALPVIPPGHDIDEYSIPQEAKWVLGFWLNQGLAHPARTLAKWARRQWPDPPAHFWGPRGRSRLARAVEKIKHWKIYCKDYSECGDQQATWFIDPPYQKAGKEYMEGPDGIDYAALGEWCRSRRGQVMVCENMCASWLPFKELCKIKGTHRGTDGGDEKTSEALWMNDPGGLLSGLGMLR